MDRNIIDIIDILSFIMGVVNYNENIDQTTLQNTAKNIMHDIHEHLARQDEKIDHIISIIEKGE